MWMQVMKTVMVMIRKFDPASKRGNGMSATYCDVTVSLSGFRIDLTDTD